MNIPEHWRVTSRVWLHLMTLGVKPDEIDHLGKLVDSAIRKHFSAQIPLINHMGLPPQVVYLRQTARERRHKSTRLFGHGRLTARKSPARWKGVWEQARQVYTLPATAHTKVDYDPWFHLWEIREIDLNLKPY